MCSLVADSLNSSSFDDGRCLDVGCGFGTVVPSLISAGIKAEQIFGVDLSPEMIRNAIDLHPKCSFEAIDFQQYTAPPGGFDCVLFCSALHDLPDQREAIRKASELLRPKGCIVIAHAQGAGHIATQVQSNPVLVKRPLPQETELHEIGSSLGLSVVMAPAAPSSIQDEEEGYLAVLRATA